MRSLTGYAVAVRQPDGGIAIRNDKLTAVTKKYPFLRFPILRGSVVLIHSLILGIKALNFSASVSSEGEEGEPELTDWAIFTTMAFAFLLGIGLFVLAPLGLTNLIKHYLFPEVGHFPYHGAEHKTVYTFEANEELCVANAKGKSTLNPRCGTSFLLFVMAVSIVVFALIPSTAPFAIKFGARIVLMPLIAGIAYEMIRFSARHLDKGWCRALIAPGLWLQRITTKEPDDKQLEIAIVALKEALEFDRQEMAKNAAA